ncbi:MAG: type II toxin-antitoxin system VapC family toxin [Aquabacterium sp.]
MMALDTNLLARLLLQDEPAQHAKVVALLSSDAVFTAPTTVFLELVWVLEAHDCTPQEIKAGLERLLGLQNFKPANGQVLRTALAAYGKGMDFADALHLGLSAAEKEFRTFDKRLARKATALGLSPTVRMV